MEVRAEWRRDFFAEEASEAAPVDPPHQLANQPTERDGVIAEAAGFHTGRGRSECLAHRVPVVHRVGRERLR
jgi:hypothetical protein